MGKHDKPTPEQEAEMALAAMDAARAKSVELGLNPLMGMYGIASAMDGLRRTAELVGIIGVDGAMELGRQLQREAELDAVRQAEDILKGEM